MRLGKEIVIGLVIAGLTGGVASAQGVSTPKGPNAKAAAEKNPTAGDAESAVRGKKLYDKRETLRRKEADREVERSLKSRH